MLTGADRVAERLGLLDGTTLTVTAEEQSSDCHAEGERCKSGQLTGTPGQQQNRQEQRDVGSLGVTGLPHG
jgi:hypothetical protein